MRLLHRYLVHAVVALLVSAVGLVVKASLASQDGDTSVWRLAGKSRSEFERVSQAINGKSAVSQVQGQRRRTNNRAVQKPPVVEPKVIEIEYDSEGNVINDGTQEKEKLQESPQEKLQESRREKLQEIRREKSQQSAPEKLQESRQEKVPEGTQEKPQDSVPSVEYETNGRARNSSELRAASHGAGDGAYHDATYHYTIDLPPAWQEMNSQELDLINQGARTLGFGTMVSYQQGFRRKNTRFGTCPYVLVQAKAGKISSYSEVEQGLNKEMPRAVKKAEGALGTLASNLSVNGAVLDRSKNCVVFRSQLDVRGIGTLQAFSVGHIGSEGVVFVHSYSLEKEFDTWLPTFEQINESFQFDEGYEFRGDDDSKSDATETNLFARWGKGWLIGAGGGALVGLITAVMRKPRRRSVSWDESQLYSGAAPTLEQDGIQPQMAEMDAPPYHEVPGPSPANVLSSTSRALTIAIPIAILGSGGWWCYNHGSELSERHGELKQATACWGAKLTRQTPDQIYSDTVERVRAVAQNSAPPTFGGSNP